jgi:anti-sigma regulatory factor (Ser/Thr protein kinase)
MRRESWLPALPEGVPQARAIVRDLASELSLDGATTWELMLATSEAFSNAVEHGRACDPRGIFLRAEIRNGRLGVEVADCGDCFATGRSSRKRRGEGGRGLRIIASIMDQFEVVPDHGATRVRFAKQLSLA